ncbi:phosphatase PAP2 family protein [Pilimelia anulata]|uniref:phosphatase PAP2 family protein n=1 Tax=Pilimelia anulata TaxID=53371 RepID=UPI00166329C2|nr:phosphatase PAP2 family protein [Pilimelia anulata]
MTAPPPHPAAPGPIGATAPDSATAAAAADTPANRLDGVEIAGLAALAAGAALLAPRALRGPADPALLATLAAAVALLAAYAAALRRGALARWPAAGRAAGALAMCATTYAALRWVVPMLRPHRYDGLLAAADRALFGTDPVAAVGALAGPGAVTALYAVYLLAPLAPLAVVVAARGPLRRDALATLLAAQYAGYAGYLILPAVGPWPALAAATGADVTGPAFRAAAIGVDAFPSLHTAWSVLAVVLAWRLRRGLALALAPFAAAVLASTLVLRCHYATDLIAGTALALAAARLVPRRGGRTETGGRRTPVPPPAPLAAG